jgi:hypothetical protein
VQISLISLAIVLVASCGGGSSKADAPATTAAPTTSTSIPKARAAYITRANALCQTMNARVAKLTKGASSKSEAALSDQAAKILSETLQKLRKLPQPPGDEAALRAIYTKIDVIIADAPKLSAALRADDQATGQRVQVKLQQESDEANALSKAYGLSVCGS